MATWKKIAAVSTASAMTLQLAACDSEQATYEELAEDIVHTDITYDETPVEPVEYDSDENLEAIEDSEFYEACEEWAEQEDGSYTCEDQYSSYHGQHFFGGVMYATMGAMLASSYYQSKARKQEQTSGSSGGASGGGYNGTGSRGSSSTSNGATTLPTDPTTNTTNSNQNVNKPSNGTTNYSSGKSGFSSGGASRGGSSSS
ncbi:hypothetical protein LZ480_18320 [Solibacillus sp. MA9]|uniref:Lipoprotein n=1 Tax=Solibacillus palustris TaxID=2908203 RepID=A0ABS9UI91_9BACL|nr:hypothetical protein [Solibacillus sp. MA9]MCH7323829.1 hypothetical protein [Solibacillus sp. MA9]